MDAITVADLTNLCIVVGSLWGGYKIIMEIVRAITQRHDREQAWDKAVNDRETLKKEFNARLDEQDAKNQQLFSMLCMCLRAQDAILEALVDKDIGNGEIKAMHKELKDFIVNQMRQ